MHRIELRTVNLSFDSAFVRMPADGSDWDWICNDWKLVERNIEVECSDEFVHIQLIGNCGPYNKFRIEELKPNIDSVAQLIEFVGLNNYRVEKELYNWGTRISFIEKKLFSVSGGRFFILPDNGSVIEVEGLELNWEKLKVEKKT